jgi:hypothetical protein
MDTNFEQEGTEGVATDRIWGKKLPLVAKVLMDSRMMIPSASGLISFGFRISGSGFS